jgi:hypothetical protein
LDRRDVGYGLAGLRLILERLPESDTNGEDDRGRRDSEGPAKDRSSASLSARWS